MASWSPGDHTDKDSSAGTGNVGSISLNQEASIRGALIAGGVRGDLHYHQHSIPRSSVNDADLKDVLASLKAMLRSFYRKLEIPKMPWLLDWYLPFEDYFVNVDLEYEENDEFKKIHMSELFKPSKNTMWFSSRILIHGAAGYGKTTLSRKLCYDYGKGVSQYIHEFELVLLLDLKEFEESLEKVILKLLTLSEYDSQTILSAVNKYQSKILIILDGIDELDKKMKQDLLMPLLTSKYLPQTTVIATSRMDSIHSAPALMHCFHKIVEIKGMQEQNTNQFLKYYLKGESEEKVLTLKLLLWSLFDVQIEESGSHKFKRRYKDLLQKARSGIHLRHLKHNLFECPLFLLLIVVVASETNITFLHTRTDFYKALFNFVLRRTMCKDHLPEDVDLFHFDKVYPPAYAKMISQFGQFAITALHKKQVSFSKEEVLHYCENDMIFQLGILRINSCKTGVKEKSWYEPVHETLLEFCAAYHQWFILIINSNQVQFFTLYDKLLPYFPDFTGTVHTLVFPFLIGLCSDQLPLLFSTLASVQKENWWLKRYSRCQAIFTESKLPESTIATALLPFVPTNWQTSYFSDEQRRTITLLKETVCQAVVNGSIQCFTHDYDFNLELKGVFIPGILQFVDPSNKTLMHCYENVSCRTLSFVLSSMKSMSLLARLTHSIMFDQLSFVLAPKYLERHLTWLISEMTTGILKESHIYQLHCVCSDYNTSDELKAITTLIRNEKVESLEITLEGEVLLSTWEEFILISNQSKELRDLSIFNHIKETYSFHLCDNNKKKWRKLQFQGGITFQDVQTLSSATIQQLMINDGIQTEDVDYIIQSNSIQCLKLPTQIRSGCTTLHFMDHILRISPITNTLQELFIDFGFTATFGRLGFSSLGYLANLQVLGLDCSNTHEEEQCGRYDEAIEHIFLTVFSNCLKFTRLELWMVRQSAFLTRLVELLAKRRNANEEDRNADGLKLHTLLLFFENEAFGQPILASEELKSLLLDGRIAGLWLGTYAEDFLGNFHSEKSANTIRFIQQRFPPQSGLVYTLCNGPHSESVLSSNGSVWWERTSKLIKICLSAYNPHQKQTS